MIGQLGERCKDNVPRGNGQSSANPQPEGEKGSDSLMKNRDAEGELKDTLRKTRGIKVTIDPDAPW